MMRILNYIVSLGLWIIGTACVATHIPAAMPFWFISLFLFLVFVVVKLCRAALGKNNGDIYAGDCGIYVRVFWFTGRYSHLAMTFKHRWLWQLKCAFSAVRAFGFVCIIRALNYIRILKMARLYMQAVRL